MMIKQANQYIEKVDLNKSTSKKRKPNCYALDLKLLCIVQKLIDKKKEKQKKEERREREKEEGKKSKRKEEEKGKK